MSQFTVTHVRKNKTSDKPSSPHFENQPESRLTITVRAATEEGAIRRAEMHWDDFGSWGDDKAAWSVETVTDDDADPE